MSARRPASRRPRSAHPRISAGTVDAISTARASENPRSTTLRTARSIVRIEPARVPSASRAAPSRSSITTSPTVPASTATASVTSATDRLAPIARRSAAGCTCTRSAISDGVSRSSSSAAPATPGSRWWNGAMPLNRCVTSVAPGVGRGARLVVGRGAVTDRDDDARRGEHPRRRRAPGRLPARA